MDFEKVKALIAETLNCDVDKVTMEASLADDLGADSLAAVELSMALEEEFDVTIADEDLPNLKTVGDLYNYMERPRCVIGTWASVQADALFPKGAAMNNQEIFELMARFDASAATSFKLTTREFSLELGKGGGRRAGSRRRPPPRPPAAAAAGGAAEGLFITAPLVGTFYAAPAPARPPLSRPGDRGEEGADRVPAGGHEDDERGAGPLRLRHRGRAAAGRGPGVLRGAADPLPGRVSPCSSGF